MSSGAGRAQRSPISSGTSGISVDGKPRTPSSPLLDDPAPVGGVRNPSASSLTFYGSDDTPRNDPLHGGAHGGPSAASGSLGGGGQRVGRSDMTHGGGAPGSTTTLGAFLNLLRASMGPGCLAVASGMSECGIVMGSIIFIVLQFACGCEYIGRRAPGGGVWWWCLVMNATGLLNCIRGRPA